MRALSSALNQTVTNIQVCVYDNASGDETSEVVLEFARKDSRVKYYCHSKNIGMIGNYMYALSEVTTAYFSLLSDDDLLFPWFLEEALQGMQRVPQAAFSAASAIIMSERGEVIRVPLALWQREGQYNPGDAVLEMISKYPIPTCILFDSRVIKEFSIDADNVLIWDCDFLLQIASRYTIYVSKRPCGIFLHHESSYSKAQDFAKWEYAYHRLSQRVGGSDYLPEEMKKVARRLIANDIKAAHRAFVLQSLFHRRVKEAEAYAESFRNNYGLSLSSFTLLAMSRTCLWFSPTIYLLEFLRKIKKIRKSHSPDDCQQYVKWLQ